MKRPKFILDQMCGRLAKWLRLMGYDATYFNDITDGELIDIANKENRVILTRDAKLVKRKIITRGHIEALIIDSDTLDAQLIELTKRLKLDCFKSLERCIECNVELRSIPKSEAKNNVPPYVYKTQDSFSLCPSCGRYYWKGTHWKHIQKKLDGIC